MKFTQVILSLAVASTVNAFNVQPTKNVQILRRGGYEVASEGRGRTEGSGNNKKYGGGSSSWSKSKEEVPPHRALGPDHRKRT